METKYSVRKIITVVFVTYVQKDLWIRTLIQQLLTKYQFFTKLPKISHIHKNRIFFKSVIGNIYTNCFYPINLMAGTCKESNFSFLPVVSHYPKSINVCTQILISTVDSIKNFHHRNLYFLRSSARQRSLNWLTQLISLHMLYCAFHKKSSRYLIHMLYPGTHIRKLRFETRFQDRMV